MAIYYDDKRTIRDSAEFWVDRVSVRAWDYCKYCYRDTPQFLFSEGRYGSMEPVQTLRCCWECGSGLEVVLDRHSSLSRKGPGDAA